MIEDFGTLPSGEAVKRITIGDAALSVAVLTYGGTMQSVHLAGVPHSLCLGFETLDDYLKRGVHMGAILGPVANRIAGGRAEIDGTGHTFERNQNGRHTLHSGLQAFSLKNWGFSHEGPRVLQLDTRVLQGDTGIPGPLNVTARYEILDGGVLEISLEATTEAPTICNLAPHPYFTLDGHGDARHQRLMVDAAAVTVTDDEKIPTGESKSVEGTAWDHRAGQRMLDTGLAYDTNFCLSNERKPLRSVARLSGERVTMEIETTEPGLQVYDGSGLETPYSGIALETQGWPDAPNHAAFPSIELRPGDISRQVTRFIFSKL